MAASNVTRKTFEPEVLASEQPVIVDFWAPWCGPCFAVGPVLDKIAAERPGELKVAGTVGARGKSQPEKALGLSRPSVADDDREPGGLRGLIARLAGRGAD